MVKKLTVKQKEILREWVDYHCETCKKPEDLVGILEFHRIRPGRQDGTYFFRNVKCVCSDCHKILNSAQQMARGR